MRIARAAWVTPARGLTAIVVASALAHAIAALFVRSPLFLPDEWIYAGLSRSFVHGPAFHIHGGTVPTGTTISYIPPFLTAPLWLIGNVSVAYHLESLTESDAEDELQAELERAESVQSSRQQSESNSPAGTPANEREPLLRRAVQRK